MIKETHISNYAMVNGKRYDVAFKDGKQVFGTVGFSNEMMAILMYAQKQKISCPSVNELVVLDTLISDLKINDIWKKLDVFYFFSSMSGGVVKPLFKMINIVNPSKHNAVIFGDIEWRNYGIKGNGINAYVDTKYNAAVDGVKFKLNDAHFGSYIFELDGSQVDSNIVCGVELTDQQALFSALTNSHRLNCGNSAGNHVDTSFKKQLSLNRAEEARQYLLTNNKRLNSTARSSFITAEDSLVLRRRTYYSNLGLSTFHAGSALTLEESNKLENLVNKALSSLNLVAL